MPIKRCFCRRCGKTFGILPTFLVILKRYTVPLIQKCWEDWCQGDSYEIVSEKWWIRCVRTVQRWLRPLIRYERELMAELRRLWQVEEPQPAGGASARSLLLDTVRSAIQQSPPSKTQSNPYFHVQSVLRALRLA